MQLTDFEFQRTLEFPVQDGQDGTACYTCQVRPCFSKVNDYLELTQSLTITRGAVVTPYQDYSPKWPTLINDECRAILAQAKAFRDAKTDAFQQFRAEQQAAAAPIAPAVPAVAAPIQHGRIEATILIIGSNFQKSLKTVKSLDGATYNGDKTWSVSVSTEYTGQVAILDNPAIYGLRILSRKNIGGETTPEPVAPDEDMQPNVLGAEQVEAAYRAMTAETDRHAEQFERMMDDEYNDGARFPAPEDKTLRQRYFDLCKEFPRAALWLRAKRQDQGAHWADNTGAGAAGRKAMEILEAGGSLEDAETALAVRRNFVD